MTCRGWMLMMSFPKCGAKYTARYPHLADKTAELVVDKAMELKFVGGVFGGNIKPTPFLCLTLKMLQIQPEKDIIVEFIKNEDFKYVRLLGAMYMRLTGTAVDCYKYLEPLYNDYRRVKSQNRNGEFELMHVDEFIDELLHSERMCDIILPRLQPERLQTPEPHRRRDGYRDNDRPRRSPSPRYRRSRSPRRRSRSPKRRSPSPRRNRHRSKSPRRHRSRSRSKSPGHHRSHRHRSHSKSPERSSKKSHKKSRRGNE
ncbi:pre-mRNA-splicing factor 38A-like isoform X3 [Cottoperca gobio]|uniref:Pre-mRNA-splicing factor 38B n=1 Tax=Cottoperca gobio TaxID=56716 RepID=A0A6J2PHZ9_COTGO|nr:pre-mRNA-splicing factor 38A-like isoform X3 [Cottoperca gobio]